MQSPSQVRQLTNIWHAITSLLNLLEELGKHTAICPEVSSMQFGAKGPRKVVLNTNMLQVLDQERMQC